MTKSETQLTLQEQLRELKIPYKGRYVPVDRFGSYIRLDDEQIDQIEALFTQALTSLKSEMEKKAKYYEAKGGTLQPVITHEKAVPLSECQRVIDGMLK